MYIYYYYAIGLSGPCNKQRLLFVIWGEFEDVEFETNKECT